MTRFDAIASVIVKADVIADVGCDHGIVAGYCANHGLAKTVIASDVSESCLAKARTLLDGKDNVTFVCCDGIGYVCDEAIIAGMGGRLISDILERAKSTDLLPETLVLMPHRDAEAVRRRVVEYGYGIEKDFMIDDGGRYYSVIRCVRRFEKQNLTDIEYAFGAFCKQPDEVLKRYLLTRYTVLGVAPERNFEKLKLLRDALIYQGESVEASI